MKNKTFVYTLVLLVGLFGAYLLVNNNKKAEVDQNIVDTTNPQNGDLVGGDTTRTSVDWNGTYTGTVPCASCEGIETTLVLNSDNTYTLAEKYIGGKSTGETFNQSGTMSWGANGSTLTLKDEKSNETRMFFVSEGFVEMLDSEGKQVTGELAKAYILKKGN